MGNENNDSHSVCNFAKFGVYIHVSFTFKHYKISVFIDLWIQISVCCEDNIAEGLSLGKKGRLLVLWDHIL